MVLFFAIHHVSRAFQRSGLPKIFEDASSVSTNNSREETKISRIKMFLLNLHLAWLSTEKVISHSGQQRCLKFPRTILIAARRNGKKISCRSQEIFYFLKKGSTKPKSLGITRKALLLLAFWIGGVKMDENGGLLFLAIGGSNWAENHPWKLTCRIEIYFVHSRQASSTLE